LKAGVSNNKFSIVVARATFQLEMSWLNVDEAIQSMPAMSVALATFHEPMSWLKKLAL
jgi:hypothetical protein